MVGTCRATAYVFCLVLASCCLVGKLKYERDTNMLLLDQDCMKQRDGAMKVMVMPIKCPGLELQHFVEHFVDVMFLIRLDLVYSDPTGLNILVEPDYSEHGRFESCE